MAAAFPDLAPRPIGSFDGAAFPADADPTGRRALIVSSEDRPPPPGAPPGAAGAHVERLWVLPLSGEGGPVELASSQFLRNPEWSPDGAWVVFESDAKSFRDLFRAPADGSAPPTRITEAPHGTFEPAWSPDGGGLAVGTSRDGNAEIYVSAADGSGPQRVTAHDADDVRPAWLADGRLSWISHRGGLPRVWVRDLDGTQHPLRQEERAVIDHDVAWSRVGLAAIVVQTSPEELEIQVRTAHGGLVATLDGPGPDEHPTWSPDGAWLAFSSSRSGSPQIWIASADGRELRQVSTCAAPCWLPRWAPAPAAPTPAP